jgi:hypothetical protein
MSTELTSSRRRRPPRHPRTPAAHAPGSGEPAASGTGKPLGLERAVQLATAIVAPTTVLTALLFYYGWVRTNALFQYFGVDATVLGFTTQDYLLRSSEALYVPFGTLLVVGLASLWLHGVMTRWLATGRLPMVRATAVVLGVVGLALFARGVAGVAIPRLSRDDFLVTPLCLGLGAVMGAYGHWLWQRQRAVQSHDGNPAQPGWHGVISLILVAMLVVLSLFWATSNYARAYGRGVASRYARQLAVRPGVVIYSAERLFLHGPGVQELALPPKEHSTYRYRYSGFRLLTESRGRLFLLPEGWTRTDGAAIVLANSDKVRVEFIRGRGA